MVEVSSRCPQCHNILLPGTNFCPHCGYQVRETAQTVSFGRQLYQYMFSFLLPPFGLVWAFKYLRSPNPQQKKVGWIIIGITVLSLVLGIWWMIGFFQNLSQQYSTYSNLGL